MTHPEWLEKTGGFAYPSADDGWDTAPGMTLRDWFAGMALQGLVARGYTPDGVGRAYDFADAMIVARKLNKE